MTPTNPKDRFLVHTASTAADLQKWLNALPVKWHVASLCLAYGYCVIVEREEGEDD